MKRYAYLLSVFLVSTVFSAELIEKETRKSLPNLNIAILPDSGDEDGKGGVFADLAAMIRDKIPVIASSSLMKILIDKKDTKDKIPVKKLFAELLDSNQWSLFKNTLSDFVVALPNNFWPDLGKIDEEKLALLGLNKNFLTKLLPHEFESLFKDAPALPINMDSLEQLFLIDQTIRKRIFLTGHGYFDEKIKGQASNPLIAQLTLAQYQRFLNFLNKIGTDILYLESCYSGGLHLLTPYVKELNSTSFAPNNPLNYFIIVNGTTDAVTYGCYKNSFKKLFDAINDFFSPNGPTIKNPFRSIVESMLCTDLSTIASVRFPGSLNYFKAINVDGKIEIITQAKVTAESLKTEKGLKQIPEIGKLSAQIKEKREKGEDTTALAKELEMQLKASAEGKRKDIGSINIKDKDAVLLYPMILPIYFVIQSTKMPTIISMIPGNAVHYIKTIVSKEFIDEFFLSFYDLEIASTKLFFIKTIGINNDALSRNYQTGIPSLSGIVLLENVFIKVDSRSGTIIFKVDDTYYEGHVSYAIEKKTYKRNPAFVQIGSPTGGEPIIFDQISEKEALDTMTKEVKELLFLPETVQFLGGKQHLEQQLNNIMKRIIPNWVTISLLK